VLINALAVNDESLTRGRLWTAKTSGLPVISPKRTPGAEIISDQPTRY
jgi:hypothetical protein